VNPLPPIAVLVVLASREGGKLKSLQTAPTQMVHSCANGSDMKTPTFILLARSTLDRNQYSSMLHVLARFTTVVLECCTCSASEQLAVYLDEHTLYFTLLSTPLLRVHSHHCRGEQDGTWELSLSSG
jgi:hypothetical protein